jgi:hypothetical protein
VLILTNHLWAENTEDVARAMQKLCDILNRDDDYSASDDGATSLASNNADDDADGCCGTGTTDYCKEVYTMAHLRGAPLAVVRVMIQHETDEHIQKLGCEALACISNENCESGSIFRIALMKIGALERALVAMKRFVAVPEIQKAACNLIGNMMGDSKTQARIVVSAGGLQAAISAMKNHVDCPMVQDYGCFVLRRLVEEGGQWAAKLVVNAGGIGLVLQALAKHLQCKQVQMEGCMVLCRLAENDEADRTYRQKIIDAKGLIAVSETIRIHTCHDDGNRSSPIIVEAHKAAKAIIS